MGTQWGTSNEYSQHVFIKKKKKDPQIITKYSSITSPLNVKPASGSVGVHPIGYQVMGPTTFFCVDWSRNIFYGNSLSYRWFKKDICQNEEVNFLGNTITYVGISLCGVP